MRVLSASSGTRLVLLGLGLAVGLMSTQSAEARGRHRHAAMRHHAVAHNAQARASVPAASVPSAYAALVIDANTGHSLYAVNENELRHPASITKVMTLYLLFEKLDKGEIDLSTMIPVSRHAASMSPTKLGLRPGQTISVENAIKAIVTRSANDMAVAVAEAVGGDEDSFARLMTRKAHALGMSRTTYVNASGLPDNRQITTARDLTVLGRAIQDHFPAYYKFFSTTSFTYAGQVIANHNHLMSRVEGMDGIKTGYTNASGFNLLSNVRRDGHHIVAVVMGGRSAASRDHIMEGLIAGYIEEAAPTRTVAQIEERSTEPAAETVETAHNDRDADEPHDASPGPSLIAPTLAVPPTRSAEGRVAAPLIKTASFTTERPRPAFVSGALARAPEPVTPTTATAERGRSTPDGSTSSRLAATPAVATTATPSSLRWTPGPQPAARPAPVARPVVATAKAADADDETTASIRKASVDPRSRRANPREVTEPVQTASAGGWVIQVGATDNPNAASSLLNRAKSQGRGALASAKPLTERIQKGSATLYRARFAGLGPEQAESACRTLKRSGFACFAVKD